MPYALEQNTNPLDEAIRDNDLNSAIRFLAIMILTLTYWMLYILL